MPVELLTTAMQLAEDVWTKLSPRCFTPVGGVNLSTQQILDVQSTFLARDFEFEQSSEVTDNVHLWCDVLIIQMLYSDCDWETLKEVRKLAGLKHKLVKHTGACILNFQCLHEKVMASD